MKLSEKKILVTGAAGFIGSEIVKKLLYEGFTVFGIDNLNSYYNPLLKEKRIENIEEISQNNLWNFCKVNLKNSKKIDQIFTEFNQIGRAHV